MHFTVIYPQLYNQLLTRERVCQRNIFSILNNSNNCEKKLELTVLNSMIGKNCWNLYPQKSRIAGKYVMLFFCVKVIDTVADILHFDTCHHF